MSEQKRDLEAISALDSDDEKTNGTDFFRLLIGSNFVYDLDSPIVYPFSSYLHDDDSPLSVRGLPDWSRVEDPLLSVSWWYSRYRTASALDLMSPMMFHDLASAHLAPPVWNPADFSVSASLQMNFPQALWIWLYRNCNHGLVLSIMDKWCLFQLSRLHAFEAAHPNRFYPHCERDAFWYRVRIAGHADTWGNRCFTDYFTFEEELEFIAETDDYDEGDDSEDDGEADYVETHINNMDDDYDDDDESTDYYQSDTEEYEAPDYSVSVEDTRFDEDPDIIQLRLSSIIPNQAA